MKKAILYAFVAITIAACSSVSAYAQEITVENNDNTRYDLVGDRPDFTESATDVPAGSIQIEGGYTYTRTEDAHEHSLGEILVRAGIHERVEVRVGFNSVIFQEKYGNVHIGKDDPSLGFKFYLLKTANRFPLINPDISLITATTLPTTDSRFASRAFQPEAKFSVNWPITDWLGFGINANYAYPYEDGDYFHQFSGSAALGFTITDIVGCYVEYVNYYQEEKGKKDSHYVDGGFTFNVNDRAQFDIRGGTLVGTDHYDYFVGAGFIFLFTDIF